MWHMHATSPQYLPLLSKTYQNDGKTVSTVSSKTESTGSATVSMTGDNPPEVSCVGCSVGVGAGEVVGTSGATIGSTGSVTVAGEVTGEEGAGWLVLSGICPDTWTVPADEPAPRLVIGGVYAGAGAKFGDGELKPLPKGALAWPASASVPFSGCALEA